MYLICSFDDWSADWRVESVLGFLRGDLDGGFPRAEGTWLASQAKYLLEFWAERSIRQAVMWLCHHTNSTSVAILMPNSY